MKQTLTFALLLFSHLALAGLDPVITCHPEDVQSEKFLSVFESPSIDALGQVGLGSYHVVNLICPQATLRASLKQTIECVGLDLAPGATNAVVQVSIEYKNGEYEWEGFNCTLY